MQKISPCLWFDTQAEQATKFYAEVFENSHIGNKTYYDESGAKVSGQPKGSLLTVSFDIAGYQIEALNGGPIFKFSPALSLYVTCKTEKEITSLWEKLSSGGQTLFELKEYPWAKKYGWCADRFGMYWQLILGESKDKIAPAFLFTKELFGKGEEAIQFYISKFKNSKISNIAYDPKTNTVLHATFTLDGQEFVLMEGAGDEKAHPMTHATSLMVNCKNQDEIDYFWKELAEGGSYEECGWLRDKYGVSWQIVPVEMAEIMGRPDRAKVENVMKEMFKMKKLDIEKLKQAYK